MSSEKIYEDGTYLNHNASWHQEDSPWKAQQILKLFKRNKITPGSVCEVGCGAGEILNQLYLQMSDATSFHGYDVSPQAYHLAVKKSNDRLNFFLEDLLASTKIFDAVLIIDVIEHVEDYYSFLEKIQPRGTYKVFHIPLDLSAQTVLRGTPILEGRKQVGHIHYFTKETALAALVDKGYTVIDYFYTAGMVELPGKALRTRLLNWPRRLLFHINADFAVRLLGGYSLMVLTK